MLPTPRRTLVFANLAALLLAAPGRAGQAGTGIDPVAVDLISRIIPRDHWPWVLILGPLLAFLIIRAVRLIRQLRRSQSELLRELQEREIAQAQLRAAEDHNRAILAALPDFMFVVNREGVLTKCHAPFPGILDAPAEECLGKHLSEFLSAPLARSLLEAMERTRATQALHVMELQLPTRTGPPMEVEARFAANRLGEVLSLVRDITQRKEAEQALRQELERARAIAGAQRELRGQLSAATSLAQAAPLCLQVAIQVAGMDSGALYLADRSSGDLIVGATMGLHPESLLEAGRPAHPDIAPRIMAATSTYTEYPDAGTVARHATGCAAAQALGIVPLRHEGSVIGGLVLTSHSLQQVPLLQRAALEAIAPQIASAIRRIHDKEALAASQGQLKELFDSLDDFLVVTDSQGTILDTNLAVAQRLGYTRQELQGRHTRDLRPPEFRMQLDAMRPELGGRIKSFCGPLMTRDGTQIPVETKFSLGLWDGKKVIIGLGRDLTERQKADQIQASLREKTALLQEIHHRIKNNLQIISSLLSLQAGQLESRQLRQVFRESQARVQAMALLHERLYQSPDLSRISFDEYLGTLAKQILRAYSKSGKEIELRLEMDALWLNTDAAMPCGLIVNELITNSCKYAFPGGNAAEIFVSARQCPEHSVTLLVGDNGVGMPPGIDFRKATTLGLQLVDDMVSQLKGSWTVEQSGGTLFRIVFPAGAAGEGKEVVGATHSDTGR